MSQLNVILHEWPEECEILISVQDDGRCAAVLYQNSNERCVGYGATPTEAVVDLERKWEQV